MPNPREVVKKLLKGENCQSDEIKAYEDDRWFVDSSSYATSEGVFEARCASRETIFNIASISKTFTAATILRMTENERFSQIFPDGINTPISYLVPALKSRYPDSNYIQNELEKENKFDEITLAHLLNHSSGIGDFKGEDFGSKLAFESEESLAQEPDGKFFTLRRRDPRPEFGKYSYSNIGYELLGMIISASASAISGIKIKCGEVVKELVIDRLALGFTFTQDQMAFDGKKVHVIDRHEIDVAQAYDNNQGKAYPSLVFRRAIATSGIYSNPTDLCKFADAFFSNKIFSKGGLFDEEQTIAARDSSKVETKPEEFYAAGYEAYKEKDGTLVRFHGAETQGFFGWLGNKNNQSACCLTSCVNRQITRPEISQASAEQFKNKKSNNEIVPKSFGI
ncbi:MAG: class A beta-lactamase-related serine hydrolase [Proteobacteria bacterium]|nr:class A beta-lactamase-related serine hydrolase [Pseudomonadota bacterium]